jgi:hypothetical protein
VDDTLDGERRGRLPLLRQRLEELGPDEIREMFAAPRVVRKLGIDYNYDEIYKQFIDHYQFPFSLELFEIYGLLAGPRYYWRYLLEQDAIIDAQRMDNYVTFEGTTARVRTSPTMRSSNSPRLSAGMGRSRSRSAIFPGSSSGCSTRSC